MTSSQLDVVTGAYSYTGRAIALELQRRGRRVRTLTNHPQRTDAPRGVEPFPLQFHDTKALGAALEGATTLYNTYWIRFNRGQVTFGEAVANSKTLFAVAQAAGVKRIVHVSVTNPSVDSEFPYFRGKAEVEHALGDLHGSYAVVRPTVTFGDGDILINNIAWLLRRIPVFAIPGDGRYRLRPVHIADVATVCVDLADLESNRTVDAVGPTTFTFQELVDAVRRAVGSRARLMSVPPRAAMAAASALGVLVRDVLLTDHELGGMMAEAAYSDAGTTGGREFTDWLERTGPSLGRRYESELARHFR